MLLWSPCPYINPVVGSTVKQVKFMGQFAKVVKVPAMVPAMAERGAISKSSISRRGSRRTGVMKRIIFLDFDMIISLWFRSSCLPC